jgi:hypothetical protein
MPEASRIPVRIHNLARLRFMTGGADCISRVIILLISRFQIPYSSPRFPACGN